VLGTLVLANKALDQTTGLSQLQFEAWTQLWNKAYDTEDEKQFRYNVWVQNADIIADLKLKNKKCQIWAYKVWRFDSSRVQKIVFREG